MDGWMDGWMDTYGPNNVLLLAALLQGKSEPTSIDSLWAASSTLW